MKKYKITRKILSIIMIIGMFVTLLPAGTPVYAEDGTGMNVTLHVYNGADGGLGYDEVYMQYWQAGTATITNATEEDFAAWNVKRYKLTAEENDWYTLTIQGSVEGFQFLNSDGSSNTSGKGYEANMASYSGDLYYKNGALYKDESCTERLTSFESFPPFLLVGNIPGIAWDQTADPNFSQVGSTDEYTATLNNVPAGNYEYKVLQNPAENGWNKPWGGNDNRTYTLSAPANVTFSINKADDTMGVTVTPTYIQDLVLSGEMEVEKGKSLTLPSTATYYAGDGTAENGVNVTYSITEEDKNAGVTLTDGVLTVPAAYSKTAVTVSVSYNGYSKDVTVNAVDKIYTFTIRYYNPNATSVDVNGPDLWVWANDNTGRGNQGYTFTGTLVDEENGITWLTTEIKVPYTKLGIIGRIVAGDWNGGQDGNQYFEMPEGNTEVTAWYVHGQGITVEKPVVKKEDPRYVVLEYERADGNYDGWGIYTWNSGFGGAVTVDFVEENGKGVAKVPITSSVSSLSFCVKQTVGDNEWANKDGGDHSIVTPLDQTIIKSYMLEGSEPQLQYPYNTGYYIDTKDNSTYFYYRDDAKYLDGTLSGLGTVKVEVDGQEYSMTYDAQTQRFVYKKTGLVEGEHTYRYNINGTYELDRFNENTKNVSGTDYSVYEYRKYNASLKASLQMTSMNSTQNNVLSLVIQGNNLETMEIAEAYVDASALGLSSQYKIDTELLAVVLSVKDSVAEGKKTLPITVVDQYGNEYKTTVDVTVVAKSEDDFDWDEAVIYFMVTDRFFDGNSSNNAANGADTYGENPGLYHGGDFAGVTEKLDYLKDLGVNTIWITPIVDNIDGTTVSGTGSEDVPYNAAYHGYWADNFEALNPALGTEEEFATLIEEAHNRDMKIMVDVVVNHTGYGADTEERFAGMIRDDADENDYIHGGGQAGLPDFVTENPEVRDKVIKWQVQWMTKFDIDYFRVDTVKHVDNTTWTAFKNALTEENPEFKMIGEYYGAGYASTFDNLGTGTMDSLLDFDFNNMASDFVVNGKIDSVETYFESRNAAVDNTATMGAFLSSHDEEGFLYGLRQNFDEDTAVAKMMVAASLQLTSKGQPVIYYGEEIGLSGANNYPYQDNRYDFDWSIANEDNAIYAHYKKMLEIRNDNTEVFAKGTRTKLAGSDDLKYLVFERNYGSDSLVVALNVTDETKTATFATNYQPGTILIDLYNEEAYKVKADKTVTISIPAEGNGGTVVLKEQSSQDSDNEEGKNPFLPILPSGPSISVIPSTPSTPPQSGKPENGWHTDKDGNRYFYQDGNIVSNQWYKKDNQWYYFDEVGMMKTGWLKHEGTWYYLNADGAMKTGWVKDKGTWYYLNTDGSMKTGWVKDKGIWYYLNTDGSMKTGWVKDKGTWYYLNTDGSMKTGWVKDKGTWYYLNADGSMKTGWIKDKGLWYYLNEDGAMATDTVIDGYKINHEGVWVK